MTEGILDLPDQLSEQSRSLSLKSVVRAAAQPTRRAAVVLVVVAAALGVSRPNLQQLLAVAVCTATWLVALRASSSGPGPSSLALGSGVITAVRTSGGLATLSVVDYWLPDLQLSAARLLLMAGGVFVGSWIVEAKIQPRRVRRRLVLIGADEAIHEVIDELARHPRIPFDVVGIVDDGRLDDGRLDGLPVARLGSTRDLGTIFRKERPDLVVLGADIAREEALSQLLDSSSLDVRVLDVHHFNEHAFGKVPVHHLSPAWFMAVLHLYQRPYSRIVKRTFDLVVASLALLLVSPLLLAVCLLVRASSSGPIFFRQLRLGEGGNLFEIRKFRTMVERAEEPGIAVWASEDDARVTAIGRVLRRARIDELPQLWNVLRGEMSIVGPRPERPEFVDLLQETVPFWTRRHLVKPGITGWAQVRRGYTADVTGTAEKLSYDLYYLKYRSLFFDLAIAARTVAIVLSGFGSR